MSAGNKRGCRKGQLFISARRQHGVRRPRTPQPKAVCTLSLPCFLPHYVVFKVRGCFKAWEALCPLIPLKWQNISGVLCVRSMWEYYQYKCAFWDSLWAFAYTSVDRSHIALYKCVIDSKYVYIVVLLCFSLWCPVEGVMRSKRRCVLERKQPYSGDEWCSGAETEEEDEKPLSATHRECTYMHKIQPASLNLYINAVL